ncbi:GroES-like protein [Xylariomycetidae sp. FL2044]|nr:GroES-like protein [Xylariomycetidae sp. FL2044]
MSASSSTTEGWVAIDKDAISRALRWEKIQLRPMEDTDVDISVLSCGICGTDIHTISDTWGVTKYPCCPGHGIVGTVANIGSKVTAFQRGDRVGVGPQGFACLLDDCEACGNGFEMRCPKFVPTHNGQWVNGEALHHGGLAKTHRANMNVVIKIPDGISSAHAAPMLCAGITAYSPLRRHGAGPGKRVGILGIGGIGHFAVLWAKALGCDQVVCISRSSSKKADCLTQLGADEFIATAEDENWASDHAGSLDLIVSTSDSGNLPMAELLGLLKLAGTFVTVGASVKPLQNVNTMLLCARMIREMLDFAVRKGVRPLIEAVSMTQANQAIRNQVQGKARYKYVLQM